MKRMFTVVLVFVMALTFVPVAAMAANSEFVIEDGVLTDYNGTGGDVAVPDGVTNISTGFHYCAGLTRITIPSSVTRINVAAFRGCTALTGFYVAADNPEYCSVDGVLFSKDKTKLVLYPGGKTGAYTIPDSVTEIDESAFKGCSGLTDIIIPDSVTTIGQSAFSECTGLTSVMIPSSVTSMGKSVFWRCTSLNRAVIADGVTDIGTWTFYGCEDLTRVTIGGGVTNIGEYLFCNCYSLASVTIPNGVTRIGDSAFSGCFELTDITIPDGVTRIGAQAFDRCKALTGISVPSSVTEIGNNAFEDCDNLARITIPGSVASIENHTFHGCKGLTSVTIGDGVTSIGPFAFSGCQKLTDITIPNSITSIGNYAFSKCYDLANITISNGVTSIGLEPFYGCANIKNVYYGGSEAGWNAVYVPNKVYDPLTTATIHYGNEAPVAVRPTEPEMATGIDTLPPKTGTAYHSTQMIEVDGVPVQFQCYALKDENGNDTNYIKLRDLAALLNGSAAQFQVGWDGEVTITTGAAYTPNGTELSTPFSGNRAYQEAGAPTKVNGQTVNLAAFVLNDDDGGYTYYQLRDLGRALGFNVGWSADKGIFVETDKPYNVND